jgi:ParB family transcriptional regulator, chromosome partitioning protein
MIPKFIDIDGKRFLRRDIVKLRQEQCRAAALAAPVQPPLFELHDDFEAHGLLQNLQVRKAASGRFEVVAGGRRHAALKLLAKNEALDSGHGIEDVAARFGVTPTVVRQRLKLAAVSPRLMALYRKAAMSLDQLMAFTVSDDHAAQEAAWFDAPDWQRSAQAIRGLHR